MVRKVGDGKEARMPAGSENVSTSRSRKDAPPHDPVYQAFGRHKSHSFPTTLLKIRYVMCSKKNMKTNVCSTLGTAPLPQSGRTPRSNAHTVASTVRFFPFLLLPPFPDSASSHICLWLMASTTLSNVESPSARIF